MSRAEQSRAEQSSRSNTVAHTEPQRGAAGFYLVAHTEPQRGAAGFYVVAHTEPQRGAAGFYVKLRQRRWRSPVVSPAEPIKSQHFNLQQRSAPPLTERCIKAALTAPELIVYQYVVNRSSAPATVAPKTRRHVACRSRGSPSHAAPSPRVHAAARAVRVHSVLVPELSAPHGRYRPLTLVAESAHHIALQHLPTRQLPLSSTPSLPQQFEPNGLFQGHQIMNS